ncbi:MAG: YitT family protein [Butyrivibrio sp.]|nr:YitT family protein [Butyrivibrio sp.]
MYIKKKAKKIVIDYLYIAVAALIYSIGTSLFSDVNNLAPGGFTGIAIALNRITGIGIGAWFAILNIPVMILGIWKFGIKFTISTIYATAMISLFTDIISKYFYAFAVQDIILGVIFGSALAALGMGIIFKKGATSGGSDIIIKILRLQYPHLKTGILFFITDVAVVIFAGVVFRDIKAALYSMLACMITSFVLDLVLYGRDGAKLIYIISDKPDIITQRLLKELDAGATHIFGEGAYSGEKKKVIMCVIKKRLSPMAEDIVREEDPDAFMIVTSATEIFGEGYKSYFDERI